MRDTSRASVPPRELPRTAACQRLPPQTRPRPSQRRSCTHTARRLEPRIARCASRCAARSSWFVRACWCEQACRQPRDQYGVYERWSLAPPFLDGPPLPMPPIAAASAPAGSSPPDAANLLFEKIEWSVKNDHEWNSKNDHRWVIFIPSKTISIRRDLRAWLPEDL